MPPYIYNIEYIWVVTVKENPDGIVNKYKYRLVAKGFHQKQGFEFNETFSPVVKPITIRIILSNALTYNWFIQQLDVNNAFLNEFLDEKVYIEKPKGFESFNPTLLCKLNKSLHKQVHMQWFERLQAALLQLQFKSCKCHPSLFTYYSNGHIIYLLVYVDDIISNDSSYSLLHILITKHNMAFSLKHLGDLD